MIFINLLPVRDIKRRNKAKQQIYFGIAGICCLVLVLSSIGVYQNQKINLLLDQQKKIESEKQQYAKILNEIKKIEEEKKILQTRIGVIKQLKQSSSLTVHVLDEVAYLTPPNRMWLKGLDQNGNVLNLNGMALDNRTVAKYMEDLENSKYIQGVVLAKSSMEKFAERDLKLFSVSCRVGIFENDKQENISK